MAKSDQFSLFDQDEIESIEESFPPWFSNFKEFKKFREKQQLKNLKVYYGFSKLNKVIKKKAIVAYFENSDSIKSRANISKKLHLIYTREQTNEEKSDSAYSNRTWTVYSKMIDQKPYNGNFDFALQDFMRGETLGVGENVKKEIESALREGYREVY